MIWVMALVTAPVAADDWAVESADARVPLTIEGDMYAREEIHLETVVNFNELLRARTLRADSLTLVDAATGETVELELAGDGQMRYASGNPILRLRWASGALGRFGRRTWHLYLGTTERGAEDAWAHLEQTFLPRPPSLLLESDLETADPNRPDRPLAFNAGGRDVEGEHTERVWTDEEARSGTRSLKIERSYDNGPPKNTNRPFWWTWPPPAEVSEGQSVQIEAWLKTVRLDQGALASVALEFRDAENRRLGNRLWLRGPRQPHDWQLMTGTVMAPANAAGAAFWFSLHGEGEAYCDDIRITSAGRGGLPELEVARGPLEDRSAFAAGDAEPVEEKTLKVGTAERPPTLDGALDDTCWQTAGAIREMEEFMRVPGTEVQTTVLVCADRDALYFGFDCQEPATDNLLAETGERDGPAWQDDSVELFLDTNRDLHSYYQIIVNPKGFFFDQDTGAPDLAGAKWDGPVTVAAQILPDRWTAEVKLEFTGLRLAEAAGRMWGANFTRTSMREGRSCYTWMKMKDSFGQPALFGNLVLPFDPSANVVTGRATSGPLLFWGEGALPFEITNNRDAPVQVRVTVADEDAGATLREERLTIQPRCYTEVGLRCAFAEPGEVKLRYDLFEEPSGSLLYTTSQAHMVPEPLALEPLTLVSHLGEERIAGTYTLGISEDALAAVGLRLRVIAEGATEPIVTETIGPQGTTGSFGLAVGGLAAGSYELRAELVRDGQVVATQTMELVRKAGPFGG